MFEDVDYGQWGLVLWGSDAVREREDHERASLINRDAYRPGDLIVGEFLGDTDRLLVRCDPQADDFGAVMVVVPIDRRKDWPQMWSSFVEFVEAFADHHGEKYRPH